MSKKVFFFAVFLLTANFINANLSEDYDLVRVGVKTAFYDVNKPPVFARVKYNKLCPLIVTSDDMGRGEFVRNWAFFNGYPIFKNNSYGQMDKAMTLLDAPYNQTTLDIQDQEMASEKYEPLTYTDGTGGIRRFSATSAIMPYKIGSIYTYINAEHARTMVRTGWSFAQHDVADAINETDREAYMVEQFAIQSKIMEEITGVGLKVLVEPNGDHSYIKASMNSNEICWNIFQNASIEYPALSKSIDDWTKGIDYTGFESKPNGAVERFFFQGKEKTWLEIINSADGSEFIMGGTHGIGNEVLAFFRDTVQPSDKFWVAGADEVWEYYHLYNNSTIENICYTDGLLTFDVKVPQYSKHQFRELTINIPGISNGESCKFSDNVITGGAKQNDAYYTINIGLEDNIHQHIEELIALYRNNFHNSYIKRDAQYLINRLIESPQKASYQSRLNADPNYVYKVSTNTDSLLIEGATDVETTVWYSYPKYLLVGTDLYTIKPNSQVPYFVNNFLTTEKEQKIILNYEKTAENVIYLTEGENIKNSSINTTSYDKIKENSGPAFALRNASNGAGGIVTKEVEVTTIPPGKYKLVVAAGDSWNDATHFASFTCKLGGEIIFSFQTNYNGVKEYIKENIIVPEEETLTIEASGTGVSRWIDYLYIQNCDSKGTGINTETMVVDEEKTYYTLEGIKVNNPTNGIYIIHSSNSPLNKKVLIKK